MQPQLQYVRCSSPTTHLMMQQQLQVPIRHAAAPPVPSCAPAAQTPRPASHTLPHAERTGCCLGIVLSHQERPAAFTAPCFC
jgi:hypothetical protein